MSQSYSSKERTKILNFIEKNGFGATTPVLNSSLSSKEFSQHYYNKKELSEFCRSVGIPATGQKNDLNERIKNYLETGQIKTADNENIDKCKGKPDSESLSLEKQVIYYKSDPKTREFFKKHIPEFTGFSALVQKNIKEKLLNNEVFTYSDIIQMHKDFLKTKNQKKSKVAHDSCQFNQFYIDYNNDPSEKIHSAKDAWFLVRNSVGDKTFKRYKEKIEEINKGL